MLLLQAPLARICKTLQNPAEQALYFSIQVLDDAPLICSVQNSLNHSQRRASYVRELQVPPLSDARLTGEIGEVILSCTGLQRLSCSLDVLPVLTSESLPALRALDLRDPEENPQLLQRLLAWPRRLDVLSMYYGRTMQRRELLSKSAFSAAHLVFRTWMSHHGDGDRCSTLLSYLSDPPSSMTVQGCVIPASSWQTLLESLPVGLEALELEVSTVFPEPSSSASYDNIECLQGFRFDQLRRLTNLRCLDLSYGNYDEKAMGPLEISPTVQNLTLTWHVSAWPFWEPLSRGLQSCEQLPALEVTSIANWTHTDDDDEQDTLESLFRDFGAITAISVMYGLEGVSLKPDKLVDWWLQHQEEALPAELFHKLVQACQGMIESVAEDPLTQIDAHAVPE